MGDFSMLNELPEMYSHCKATEDKDMTPLDFITDHLVNIDGLFDKHENGDKQKPHSPIQNHHHGITIVSFINYYSFSITPVLSAEVEPLISLINFSPSKIISKLLRPPIMA